MSSLQTLTMLKMLERRADYCTLRVLIPIATDGEGVEVNAEKVLEILTSAIQGIDAISRILDFAEELEASEGPASGVAKAFAEEIRSRLKGQR